MSADIPKMSADVPSLLVSVAPIDGKVLRFAYLAPTGRLQHDLAGSDVPLEIERGRPDASLGQEYERRKHIREQRTREAHPVLGDLVLALRTPPQHETAFRSGERGEQAVAESLEKRTSGGDVITLYNRRMPSGRGDIDVIAVAPAGVFVIDVKNWTGRVRLASPIFGQPNGNRDRTDSVDGVDRQVAAVRLALEHAGKAAVTLHSTLCFTKADLPLLGTSTIRGHLLLYRKG